MNYWFFLRVTLTVLCVKCPFCTKVAHSLDTPLGEGKGMNSHLSVRQNFRGTRAKISFLNKNFSLDTERQKEDAKVLFFFWENLFYHIHFRYALKNFFRKTPEGNLPEKNQRTNFQWNAFSERESAESSRLSQKNANKSEALIIEIQEIKSSVFKCQW